MGSLCSGLNITKALLVSDKFLVDTPVVGEAYDLLCSAGIEVSVFSEITGEPDINNVNLALEAVDAGGCDGVVSIGGGSCIDAGKAVAVLATNSFPFLDP